MGERLSPFGEGRELFSAVRIHQRRGHIGEGGVEGGSLRQLSGDGGEHYPSPVIRVPSECR